MTAATYDAAMVRVFADEGLFQSTTALPAITYRSPDQRGL